jgi:hypothetical protein
MDRADVRADAGYGLLVLDPGIHDSRRMQAAEPPALLVSISRTREFWSLKRSHGAGHGAHIGGCCGSDGRAIQRWRNAAREPSALPRKSPSEQYAFGQLGEDRVDLRDIRDARPCQRVGPKAPSRTRGCGSCGTRELDRCASLLGGRRPDQWPASANGAGGQIPGPDRTANRRFPHGASEMIASFSSAMPRWPAASAPGTCRKHGSFEPRRARPHSEAAVGRDRWGPHHLERRKALIVNNEFFKNRSVDGGLADVACIQIIDNPEPVLPRPAQSRSELSVHTAARRVPSALVGQNQLIA